MACYQYQLKHGGKPRPKRLIEKHMAGSTEFCECGKPATHTALIRIHDHDEPLPLCADCYAIEQQHTAWYGDGKPTGTLQQGKRLDLYGDD